MGKPAVYCTRCGYTLTSSEDKEQPKTCPRKKCGGKLKVVKKRL